MLAAVLVLLTVKVSTALLVAWTLTRAMTTSSAASRHLVWTLAFVSMLALPAAHFVGPRWDLAVLPVAAPARVMQSTAVQPVAQTSEVLQAERFSPVPAGPESRPRIEANAMTSRIALDLASILLIVWLGGTTVGLLRFLTGLVSVYRIMRRASPVSDPDWLASLGDAMAALGLTTSVQLKSSVDTRIPVACGVVTPAVLLPADATNWSADRRRVVLLHELAHITRHDCLVQSIAHIARAVHWFNPLAHLATSQLRAEQERACDDLVLAAGTDGPLYAHHLIEIARASSSLRSHGWAVPAMAHRSHLEGRLMAILNDRNRRPPARWVRTVVASAGAAAIGLLGTLQLTAAAGRADIESSKLWRASVPTREGVPDGVETSSNQAIDPLPAPAPAPNPEPDAKPAPMPNPRLSAQLKAASGSQAPDVSDETRRRVANALETALADANEEVRVQALWALGGIRDERAVPRLLKGTQDASPRVRMAALSALAQFSTPEATDGIVAALKDSNADVRALAVRYVSSRARKGALNDAKYVDVFVGLLRDGAPDVRVQAIIALGRLGRTEGVPALLPLLEDASIDVRKFTAAALGDIADPRAVDALTAALKDNESEVRERAARALGQIARGQRGGQLVPPPPPPPVPLPGASLLPLIPPRVPINLDAIGEIVSRAQEEARRSLEEFARQRQELQRQQEELQRQLR